MNLTPRHKQFLAFLKRYREQHGVAPTYREISIALGITSKGSVSLMVDKLRENGFIRQDVGQRRGIRFP